MRKGFTLIEMSIVLVIIGLIVGGVLTGRDLIKAAEARATITQLDKYNAAINTFYGKYNYLPGDIPAAPAAQFGFVARGTLPGQGDGNGLIAGNNNTNAQTIYAYVQSVAEPVVFWMDLSSAGLIDGKFTSGSQTAQPPYNITTSTSPLNIGSYLPPAKIGQGNYINVWTNGSGTGTWIPTGPNYFSVSAVNFFSSAWAGSTSGPGLSVAQAYSIDKKIDDGLPQSGNVTAQYVDAVEFAGILGYGWAGSGGITGGAYTTATPGSANTCFDNSNAASGTPGIAGATQHYSIEINGGSNVNCALSFRFQ